MAQATSGEKIITVDGEKYRIRTQTVYQDGLGTSGTLSTTAPIRYTVEYLPLSPIPIVGNPLQPWILLGERDTTSQNNWIFTPAAGAGFRRALIENGPTSLTVSLDDATTNALSQSSGVTKQQATQILQVAPNVAPTAPDPVQPTPAAPAAPAGPGSVNDLTPADLTSFPIASSVTGTRKDFGDDGNLRYPLKLDLSKQDCIKFSMETNEGRSLGANIQNQPFGALGPRVTTQINQINGSVTLPIQSGITDSNGVEWGGANLDPKDRYLASLALKGITSSDQGLAGLTGDLLGKVVGDLKNAAGKQDFKNAFNLYLAQEAVGIQGLLSRASGAIVNPNLELLFNGPTLRSFTFTFRLSPRSKPEAANVRRIIRYFKEGMVVKTAAQEVFLKSPNIFNIQYLSSNAPHKSLPRIKKCALLGCDVDYTPDGTYMTFNDDAKTMTSYQLSLRFSELEPLYSKDYTDLNDIEAIGY